MAATTTAAAVTSITLWRGWILLITPKPPVTCS
jgi:hypothetical protein